MKKILYGVAVLVLTAWAMTVLGHNPSMDVWWWRKQLILLTGLGSFVLMSLIMLLAIRPLWLEKHLHGLDKSYRLHKWAGIWAIALALGHYLLDLSKDLLLVFFERGIKEPRIETFLEVFRGAAKDLGEWSVWILGIMLVITLWQRFPYHLWRYAHKALAVIYVVIAFHGVVLAPVGWWTGPAGLLLAVSTAVGVYAAFIALTGQIGRTRRYQGHVLSVKQHKGEVLEVTCQLPKSWTHKPGQFAFLTFDRFEGAHPFTLCGADQGNGQVTFAIKALGDYTTRLQTELEAGRSVAVEGPYGCFDLQLGGQDEQVWIGAGIGVTPFIAWLQALQAMPQHAPKATLYYCVNNAQEALFAEQLQNLAAQVPSITLHLHYSDQQGHLSAEQALQAQSAKTQVWFCGPQGFADALQKGMQDLGCPARNFHKEYFQMR